jgi:hypothetical protein
MPRVARGRVGSRAWWRSAAARLTGPARLSTPITRLPRAGHDLRAGPGPDLGGVLGEGHVADVVQAVLDRPMPTQQVGEPGGAGLGVGQARNRVDDHGPPPPGAKVAGLAGDLNDLRAVREPEPTDRDRLEGAQLDPAVRAVAGAVQDGHPVPGQPGATAPQQRLVGLDREQMDLLAREFLSEGLQTKAKPKDSVV